MEFFEKDLETIIFNSNKGKLLKRGLDLTGGKLFRQFRIGNYGIADLVHICRDFDEYVFEMDGVIKNRIVINIIELKKEKIGISAFLQAVGYANGIISFLSNRDFDQDVKINITLIGRELDSSGNFCFLPSLLSCKDDKFGLEDNSTVLKIYTYKYDFDGITFSDQSGFKLKDEGF